MNLTPVVDKEMSSSEIRRRISIARETEHSTWSILEVVDNMDDQAVEGESLFLRYKGSWDTDYDVTVCLPINPTWEDLRIAANQAIQKSGDHHHRYIEGFELIGDEVILHTGS
jgi:hypothetical protein